MTPNIPVSMDVMPCDTSYNRLGAETFINPWQYSGEEQFLYSQFVKNIYFDEGTNLSQCQNIDRSQTVRTLKDILKNWKDNVTGM